MEGNFQRPIPDLEGVLFNFGPLILLQGFLFAFGGLKTGETLVLLSGHGFREGQMGTYLEFAKSWIREFLLLVLSVSQNTSQ